MSYSVVWTERASADLEEIYVGLLEITSFNSAEKHLHPRPHL